MAHTLTFDSNITCTVNGTSVSSGYILNNGDVIVASAPVGAFQWSVNNYHAPDGTTLLLNDTDIDIKRASSGGGSN